MVGEGAVSHEQRRQDAQSFQRETEPPLERLAAIHARLERIRTETESVVDRVRAGLDSSSAARQPGQAQPRLSQLRRDLEGALDEVAGLRTAMETRGVIEQAKGMIMTQLKVDADTAFDVLVRRSQRVHRKLVDVAHDVVEAGRRGLPTDTE